MNRKLIIDVGFHNGDDTFHYLREGYNVVAIEADPVLWQQGQEKFASRIQEGKLTLLNVGIADQDGTLPFYKNLTLSVWNSFDKESGTRNGKYEIVPVKTTRFANILKEYGVPYYLKVDIESYDIYCLEDLDPQALPTYVSCEADNMSIMDRMHKLGYTKFKIIDQFYAHKKLNLDHAANPLYFWYYFFRFAALKRIRKFIRLKYPKDCSGPFGEETNGPWLGYDEAAATFEAFYKTRKDGKPLNHKSWFDIHATK